MVRRYQSAVRDAKAQQTRERILQTTLSLLEAEGAASLTIPRVAREAGVSIPTVYRHFPTVADLLGGFFAWLRPRIGMTVERLLESSRDRVLELPAENFPRFERYGDAIRAVMDSPEANRVRQGSVSDRASRAAAMFRAPGWKQRDLEGAVGAVYAMQTPQTWRWFRDTWGLDADQTRAAALWAMRVLSEAIDNGPPRRTQPTKRKEKKK